MGNKKRSINRLQAMYPLRAKVEDSYKRSVAAMDAGEPVVWGMLNFYYGDPILKSMGIETVYPENYGAAVAASGAASRYLELADADGFPTHLCGYSRVNFGYTSLMMKEGKGEVPKEAPMGGMPKPLFLMASAAICDARYKWFQALGRYMDVPVWVLEAPLPGVKEMYIADGYEQAVKLNTKNLKKFVGFVESISGRRMDWDRLDKTVDLMIEMNRIWYETNLLRKVRPCPMHSRDFYSAMTPALFLMGDLEDTLQCYKNLHREVEARVANKIGSISEERYRLVFGELPPWHSLSLFNRLADRGWNFVMETFGYHPPLPLDLSLIRDPLERISRFNLQFLLGYYSRAKKEQIVLGQNAYPFFEYARDWKCDGAFLHPLISCRSASTHLPHVAEILQDRLKVPSLTIEGDIVDLRLFDPEEALAKAEAFEETMDYYRSVRKDAGFDW